VQKNEEVPLEGLSVEGEVLHHIFMDAADVAHGSSDRVADPAGASLLEGPVEFLGDLQGVDLRIITVLDGGEARSTGKDGLEDGAAGHLAVPLVNATRVVLDVEELVAVSERLELRVLLQALERHVDSTIGGVHGRRVAVGEHRHEHTLTAVDQHGKHAGIVLLFTDEASVKKQIDPGILGPLGLLAIEGRHGALGLRHLLA